MTSSSDQDKLEGGIATREEAKAILATINPDFRTDRKESTEKTASQIEAHKLLNRITPWMR